MASHFAADRRALQVVGDIEPYAGVTSVEQRHLFRQGLGEHNGVEVLGAAVRRSYLPTARSGAGGSSSS